jgi:hypothetical protein
MPPNVVYSDGGRPRAPLREPPGLRRRGADDFVYRTGRRSTLGLLLGACSSAEYMHYAAVGAASFPLAATASTPSWPRFQLPAQGRHAEDQLLPVRPRHVDHQAAGTVVIGVRRRVP